MICIVCGNRKPNYKGALFKVPFCKERRFHWIEATGMNLNLNDFLCCDHFEAHSIIKAGNKHFLTHDAVPIRR